jgi:hypothetical protein
MSAKFAFIQQSKETVKMIQADFEMGFDSQ